MEKIKQSTMLLFLFEDHGWKVCQYPDDTRYVDSIEAWKHGKKISLHAPYCEDLRFTYDYGTIKVTYETSYLYDVFMDIPEEELNAIIALGRMDKYLVELIVDWYREGSADSIKKTIDRFLKNIEDIFYFYTKPIDWDYVKKYHQEEIERAALLTPGR